ncbi:glycosyltransferase family 4 protein [Pontibacter locisalis]|uniref:Glycosyltransferase family 4 protein n=1 Tax=Pontibacter locisalis TaxID=1719035 RepID=A0ABW5IQ17_9BACT
MNIGMILDSTFPPDPRVENEALSLIRNGHSVYLYCLDYTHSLPEYEVINRIHVHRQRLPKHLYSFSALAYTIPYYHASLKKSIAKFVTDNGIQALHIHDIQVARSVISVAKKMNLPTVLDLHENRPEIMKHYAHVKSFLGRLLIYPSLWKKYEYKYIKKATKVIVVTEDAKEYYLERIAVDPDKIYVVPNTVRKEFYTNYEVQEDIIQKYKDTFNILYLGDTGLRRGIVTAIKSLKYLIDKIPNVKLVIVGKSITDPLLKELITELGYEKYVDLTGWKNFELFPSYILASHIGVCPIHKNIHHETTYANKLFQYLAFGKPIVVSDCKAQANLVTKYNCGLIFKDQDEEDFAAKVLELYEDKSLYQNQSANGKKAIEESLNWDVVSNNLIKLYEEI